LHSRPHKTIQVANQLTNQENKASLAWSSLSSSVRQRRKLPVAPKQGDAVGPVLCITHRPRLTSPTPRRSRVSSPQHQSPHQKLPCHLLSRANQGDSTKRATSHALIGQWATIMLSTPPISRERDGVHHAQSTSTKRHRLRRAAETGIHVARLRTRSKRMRKIKDHEAQPQTGAFVFAYVTQGSCHELAWGMYCVLCSPARLFPFSIPPSTDFGILFWRAMRCEIYAPQEDRNSFALLSPP
jgi:hypothetical protein